MSAWDTYDKTVIARGGDIRGSSFIKEERMINRKMSDSISCYQVPIFCNDSVLNIHINTDNDINTSKVVITNTDTLNVKVITTEPGEKLELGSLVYWMGGFWLINEVDLNNTIYGKGKMKQCNHLLKWVSNNDVILEQWCVVEDSTETSVGEHEDGSFIVTKGDSRVVMTISRNSETIKFRRGARFIIDDDESTDKLVYELTKPIKVYAYNGYGDGGVYKFSLREVNSTTNDNIENGIADYYLHFPKVNAAQKTQVENHILTNNGSSGGEDSVRKVWI